MRGSVINGRYIPFKWLKYHHGIRGMNYHSHSQQGGRDEADYPEGSWHVGKNKRTGVGRKASVLSFQKALVKVQLAALGYTYINIDSMHQRSLERHTEV